MTTRSGVGYTENTSSKTAGEEAARAALSEAGIDEPDFVWLFHTAKQDPKQILEGVRSVVGPAAKILGGNAGGITTRDQLGYDGYQAGVAVIASDTIKFETFVERRLNERGEVEVGRELGKQIKSREYEGAPGIIYMYDSVKRFSEAGFDMNIGTYIVQGLTESLGTWPSAAGMGMIGNIQFNPTFQIRDDEVMQQAAMALVMHGGGCRLDTTIFHGCKPGSDYHTITKADRNLVLEIDGKPALDMIATMLGPGSDKVLEDYPLFVTLGVNKGNKYGEYKEEEYANRLCMAIDKERRGLVMFEPDLTPGTEVQLMRRSVDFEYIRRRAEALYASLGDRRPFFALYIDCMGRAGAYCGSEQEEGAEIQKAIGSKIPLLGLYTGVELGDVGNARQQALDWSGVLCVFSE